jgi:predicted MFS family arabinose efflux permease
MSRPSPSPVILAIGGCFALAAAMGLGRFLYTPVLPFMAEAVPLTAGQAGLIASANFLGYMLGAWLAAAGLFKHRVRAWFLVGLMTSALSTAAMGLADGMAAFLGLRFLGGAASAFTLVFSTSLIIERLARAGRTELTSILFGGVGIGIAISAVLVDVLAARDLGWRAQWLWGGGLSLIGFVAAFALIPRRASQPAEQVAKSGGALGRRLIGLIVAYGLFGFGYVITATFISTIVRATPELHDYETTMWLIVGLAGMPSVWLWYMAARHIGLAMATMSACLVLAVGVALSVLSVSVVAVALAAALLGGTLMGITALGLVYARELSDIDPRRSLGLMTASFGLGQMIGPAYAGWMHGITGSFMLPSLTATLALVISAGLIWGGRWPA